MDLCFRIPTAICKKEGKFDFSLSTLYLNLLDSLTADSLFCPSITQEYIDACCLSDTVLGSGNAKMDHVSLSTSSSGSPSRRNT